MHLTLSLLPEVYAVCRLAPQAALPGWALAGRFWSVARSDEELSLVCEARLVEQGQGTEDLRCEPGWRCLKVEGGPLDFGLVGVLAALTGAIARAGVGLFAVSTYNTDYLLVKEADLERACAALRAEGHCQRMTNE